MKVLIVRLSALGDVIQGIPCMVALKRTFPNWEISWLVESSSADILKNHPLLTRLHVLDRSWRKGSIDISRILNGTSGIFAMARDLKRERYDVAIDLQGIFKSGLWTYLSGAPRRVGFNAAREMAHLFLNEFVGNRPMFDPEYPLFERYLAPALHLGAEKSQAAYELPATEPAVQQKVDDLLRGIPASKPVVAFCPWSAWPSKNWPLDRWMELARELTKRHEILLIGSAGEAEEARMIQDKVPEVRSLVGKTSIPELIEVFRRTRLVVGADTGPMHLANATGIPRILMLFGSTSWKRSGPIGQGNRAISTSLKCQPCFKRLCPLEHLNCQRQLELTEVCQTIVSLGF
jgi:lipopolysaccharide heptosyltransferase I